MGKAITAAAQNDYDIVAGIDINASSLSAACSFPVYENIEDFPDKADVIVDFSHHSALPSLIEYAKRTKTPLVIATTGHTEEELQLMKDASKEIAVFFSGNFSIGINLMINLAKQAAKTLGMDFDVEIIVIDHSFAFHLPNLPTSLVNSFHQLVDKHYFLQSFQFPSFHLIHLISILILISDVIWNGLHLY